MYSGIFLRSFRYDLTQLLDQSCILCYVVGLDLCAMLIGVPCFDVGLDVCAIFDEFCFAVGMFIEFLPFLCVKRLLSKFLTYAHNSNFIDVLI